MSSKNIKTSFSPNIKAPLLDRMLASNKARSKAEGVDIDAMSEANPLATSLRKENHKWEDLEVLDQSIAEGIVLKGEQIAGAYKSIVQNKVEHSEELRLSVETYMQDMDKAADDLLTIRSLYSDRKGSIDPKKDLIAFTAVTTDYLGLKDRVSQLTLPVVLNLSEAQIEIEADLREQQRASKEKEEQDLQNKDVVSDVSFTESK